MDPLTELLMQKAMWESLQQVCDDLERDMLSGELDRQIDEDLKNDLAWYDKILYKLGDWMDGHF